MSILRRVREFVNRMGLLDGVCALAFSGGKDSVFALWALKKIKANLACILSFAPREDPEWEGFVRLAANRFETVAHIIGAPCGFLKRLEEERGKGKSPCSYCARIRRIALLKAAALVGVKVLVFAHNLNDCAETFLVNVFFSARTEPLHPKVLVKDFGIYIERPFLAVARTEIERTLERENLKAFQLPCPYRGSSRRMRFRKTVEEVFANPKARFNFLSVCRGFWEGPRVLER